jgi:hypothetical protein
VASSSTTCCTSCCTTAGCPPGITRLQRDRRGAAHGGTALHEIATRFGDDVFYSAMDAMLERNKRAMRELIRRTVPERSSTSRTTSATTA